MCSIEAQEKLFLGNNNNSKKSFEIGLAGYKGMAACILIHKLKANQKQKKKDNKQ